MNRWILGLVVCASNLVAPGLAGAQEAKTDGDLQVAHRFEEIRQDETAHQLAFEEALMKLQTRDRLVKAGVGSKAHDF